MAAVEKGMEEKISLERAVELIEASIAPLPAERVPVLSAHGRVLAEDITAPIDQPPFPRSPLDGYALRSADTSGAGPDRPIFLDVTETLYAGGWTERTVGKGEAVRIMTGAPIPRGCDCVVRQEETEWDGAEKTNCDRAPGISCDRVPGTSCRRTPDRVALFAKLHPWENYCFQGEDYKTGEVLLPAGTCLDAAGMGVLASAGLCRRDFAVAVRRTPRIALLCTGDELVSGETVPLPPGKIYSSNAVYIKTRLQELGMEVVTAAEQWSDDPKTAAGAVRELAKQADAVITTGGVSVGAKDIFHQVLPLLGADRLFWRVLIKPGTPLMYSLYRGTPILSLSGNPFAAAATFELLGRRLLAALSGNPGLLPVKTQGRLLADFPKKSGVRRFLRGYLKDGTVELPDGHSSGQIRSLAGTNCLAEIEEGRGPVSAGETVTVHIL